MSALSTPLKNDIAAQRDIFRLAASMYANTCDTYSATATQLEMVKCVFLNNNNVNLSCSEAIASLLDVFKYHISEDELLSIIKRNKNTFVIENSGENETYRLTETAYSDALDLQQKNIDYYIDSYITHKSITDREGCRDAIHRYLYELTTTNINSYRVLLIGKKGENFTDSELSVNIDELVDEERIWVRGFLDWDNDEKNIALGNIVYCCLEYCLLVNGDSPNKLLLDAIRHRDVYLDTNVIFRALGINGDSRKRVVHAFLKKCHQARIKLIISAQTKREFQDAIAYYISQIREFPRGNIYLGAYESLSDYSIFSFYEDWVQLHSGMSLGYFTTYIKSLYAKLIDQYDIADGVKIPDKIFRSDAFRTQINAYSASIRAKKQEIRHLYEDEYYGYSKRDSHDATVIRYIEMLREEHGSERDIFFVSSDKALRYWDMTRRGTDYPTVIYPSQLFLILIKLCGRSESDYDSFVSFINIRSKSQQLSPEKANIIVAGISTITEDIQTQQVLVSAVFGEDFQNIIRNSNTDIELYQNVQTYSQNYLEDQLREQAERIAAISSESSKKDAEIDKMRSEAERNKETLKKEQGTSAVKTEALEMQKERICAFAEKQIKFKFVFLYYLMPMCICLFWIITGVFLVLQFAFCDKEWNIIFTFSNWLDTTALGKKVGDALYAIDLALCGIGCAFTKVFFKNPFDKETRDQFKTDMIKKYITNHNLF